MAEKLQELLGITELRLDDDCRPRNFSDVAMTPIYDEKKLDSVHSAHFPCAARDSKSYWHDDHVEMFKVQPVFK